MESKATSKRVLSTKLLSEPQKKLFTDAKIEPVAYDAIQIEFLDFETPTTIKNAIFTSKNAVYALRNSTANKLFGQIQHSYCVGKNTRALLEEIGQKVTKTTEYASELANFIVKECKNEVFYFFCGNLRSDEIPTRLKNAKIDCFEVKTYKTELNSVKFEQKWDYILFFSPSCVQSFIAENNLNDATAICIGTTTASEAKKHTKNVCIAEETTIDSVIAKAISLVNESNI